MDINFIKDLAIVMKEVDLSELEYSTENSSIKLVRNNLLKQNIEKNGIINNNVNSNSENIQYIAPLNYEYNKNDESDKESDDSEYIKSTMIGTFYSKPSPQESVFVNIGNSVKKGSTLCIIESMKLMNEIKAPFDCKILDVLVKEDEVVEFGQNLFKVEML